MKHVMINELCVGWGFVPALGKWHWNLQLWAKQCPQILNSFLPGPTTHRGKQLHDTSSKNIFGWGVFSFAILAAGKIPERLN